MGIKVKDLQQGLKRLGFVRVKKKGGHARWKHIDGRATSVPDHGSNEIGGGLFKKILIDIDISEEKFKELL